MINILRYTEYIYLVVAFFAAYRVIELWGDFGERFYLFVFFFVVSLGMFLFRRSYRRRFERRRQGKS